MTKDIAGKTIKIIVPGELPGTNEIIELAKRHPMAYANAKKEHTEAVAWACKVKPKPKLSMPVNVFCKWITKNLRKDPDNVSGGIKFVLDGLVVGGVLPDDRRKQINSLNHGFGVDKQSPRVEIIITEAVVND